MIKLDPSFYEAYNNNKGFVNLILLGLAYKYLKLYKQAIEMFESHYHMITPLCNMQ